MPNPEFLMPNPEFLMPNPEFLMPNADYTLQRLETGVERGRERYKEEVIYLKTRPREYQKWMCIVRFCDFDVN